MLSLSEPAVTGEPIGEPATALIVRPPAEEKSAATTEPDLRVTTGGATTVRVFIAVRPLESAIGELLSTPRTAVIEATAPEDGTRQVCDPMPGSTNL